MTDPELIEIQETLKSIPRGGHIPLSLDDKVLNFITFAEALPDDNYVASNVYKLREAILEFRRSPSAATQENAVCRAVVVRNALAIYSKQRDAD